MNVVHIPVIDKSINLVMNEDGEFVCPHNDVDIEAPCCSTPGSSGYIECGCGGMHSVYCNDCHNEDMTDSDIERILGEQ